MCKCLDCDIEFKNEKSLGWHIRLTHGGAEEYYLRHNPRTFCAVCSGDTKFLGRAIGYRDCCSHTCSAIVHRKNLKNDPEKEKEFKKKLSERVKKEWKEKDQTSRVKNIRLGVSKFLNTLTDEERYDRSNWFGKLSDEEKRKFKNEVLLKTGMFRWHREASVEDKQKMYGRRQESLNRTWDLHAPEIMKKQTETFLKNRGEMGYFPSEGEIINTSAALSEVFNVENV